MPSAKTTKPSKPASVLQKKASESARGPAKTSRAVATNSGKIKVASSSSNAPKATKKNAQQKGARNAKSPGEKVQPPEHEAAVKIQKIVRGFLAKKRLQRVRIERRQYEELMEKLEKEAWLSIVQREREEAEKQRQKEEAERKKKAAEKRRQQQILEAAFDGDVMLMKQVLSQAILALKDDKPNLTGPHQDLAVQKCTRNLVNCEDANGNTPISEAAAGGDPQAIRFLLDHGASVNRQGAFRRTPLFRAAFAGHVEAVECLLENGADPRLADVDGCTPDQIAAISTIVEIINGWDISETDRLIELMERKDEDWKTQSNSLAQEEAERTEREISDAAEEHKTAQLQLRKAYEELNKRILEHDKCALQGGSKAEITLKMIHDAEDVLTKCQTEETKAREKLAMSRLKLREQKGAESSTTDLVAKFGTKCHIRELDDVLFRDVGDKIQNDGRWPLIIDPTSQASTFLRYRDTNYIQALNPKEMEPEVVRKALLGGLRYGKFFVIDMMEVDMLEVVKERLDCIQQNLYNDLVSKDILQKERYLSLVRSTDGEEYMKTRFLESRLSKFRFVLVSKIWNPSEDWLRTFYPIRVVTSAA